MEENNKRKKIQSISPIEDIVLDYIESDEVNGNSNKINEFDKNSTKKQNVNEDNLSKINRSSNSSQKNSQNLSKKLNKNVSEQSSNLEHHRSSTSCDINRKNADCDKPSKQKTQLSAETENNLELNSSNNNFLSNVINNANSDNQLHSNTNELINLPIENSEINLKKKNYNNKKENEDQHEQKRPRTPLSPCPDNASQNGDDFDEVGIENEKQINDFYNDQGQNICRNDERESSYSSKRRLSAHSPIRMPSREDNVPQAYQKRQKRNGQQVRVHQVAMDRRLAINKRNRILRLREAQRHRLNVSRLRLPPRLPLRRSSYRSTKFRPSSTSRKTQAPPGRRNSNENFDLKECLTRRNPAYYPPPRSRKSRTPPPSTRVNSSSNRYLTNRRDTRAIPSLFPSFAQRRYTPVDRYSVDKRNSAYNAPSYSLRKSRSPRELVSYRPPPTRHRTNMVYETSSFNNINFNSSSPNARNYNNRAYCNSYNNRIHSSVPSPYPSLSRRRSRSPQIYEGGNRVSVSSSTVLNNRIYHRNNTYPSPIINKTFNKNYSRGGSLFRNSSYRGRGSGREISQQYGKPVPLKRWHCPKRESSPAN